MDVAGTSLNERSGTVNIPGDVGGIESNPGNVELSIENRRMNKEKVRFDKSRRGNHDEFHRVPVQEKMDGETSNHERPPFRIRRRNVMDPASKKPLVPPHRLSSCSGNASGTLALGGLRSQHPLNPGLWGSRGKRDARLHS